MSESLAPKFISLSSHMIPILSENIDTDQITPARFLKVTDRSNMAEALFAEWRKDPGFILNHNDSKGSQILLVGDNFGCGSSREHAAWALVAYGIRAIVSTSFADIFASNSLKNGVLPIKVDQFVHRKLVDFYQDDRFCELSIDLESRQIELPDGDRIEFPIDNFSRTCLLRGIDQLGYMLGFSDDIDRYERLRPRPYQVESV